MSEQEFLRKAGSRDDPATAEAGRAEETDASAWMEAQRDLAKGLSACGTVEDCLAVAHSCAMRLPGVDGAAVCLQEGETGKCRVIGCRELPERQVELILAGAERQENNLSAGEVGVEVRCLRKISISVSDDLAACGFPHVVVISWHGGQGVLALLVVASKRHRLSEGLSFVFMDSVGTQCASTIVRVLAKVFHETRLSERTRALEETNAALKMKSAKLEFALEASRAGVSIWNVETGLLEMDSRIWDLYGLPCDQPISVELALERVHPDDREWLYAEIASIHLPGGRDDFSHEFRIIHPEAGVRWISRRGRVERDENGSTTRSLGISFDITRIKREEQMLRASEEKYRRLHESMMDAFACVDMEGKVLDCNPAFEAMLGYSREELLEMNFNDFTHEKWHGYERRILDEQVLTRGYSEIYEKEYLRKDGTLLPVELRACALWNDDGEPCAIWGIVRDIAERKRVEAAMREWNAELEHRVAERTAELKQSEARFRKLTELTAEGIAITEGGILLDGNPQLARMHGYELEEMIGRPVMDFIAPQSKALVLKKIRNGVEEPYEAFELHKDGSVFPVLVQARMGIWEGRAMRATSLCDLTESRRISMQLQTQQAELERVRSLALVAEVSAGIVHQVAQPLSAMTLNIAAAIQGLTGCREKSCGSLEIVRELEADVRRMREAVYHLRALTSPDRRSVAELEFNEMVESVVRTLRQEALNRGVTIELNLGERIPRLKADRVQLIQVVINLLRNSLEACEPREPGQRLIRIRTTLTKKAEIELEVKDTGMGIPDGDICKLFTPFFTTKADGLGMGLRLAQRIMEAHGGVIGGGNNPDGPGARFYLTLPVVVD